MTIPLESFGMIGDGETVALVSRHGSIDWLCLPRFDSPACFASLLGTPDNGHWSVRTDEPTLGCEQRYEPDTLILETDLTTAGGTVRITDFMPIRECHPVLIRIVSGLSGTVAVCAEAVFRFDYGNMPPWITREDDGTFLLQVGPDEVRLQGLQDAEIEHGGVRWRRTLAEGDRHVFTMSYRSFDRSTPATARTRDQPEPIDPSQALDATRRYWRDWIGRCEHGGEWAQTLRRSLLTVKALLHRPTGGLVAAPTTSLPERPGGSDNWDYRYCWLRDASFTLSALVGCGYLDEAKAWRDWILRATAGAPGLLHIVYRVDGSRRLDEAELEWLAGYRFARPVRIGNAAAAQFQLDVYGELMNTLYLCEQAGLDRSPQAQHLERVIVDHVEQVWVEPDQGLWESRGEPRHYTYSKVMAWVAVDRFLRGAGSQKLTQAERRRLEALRSRIHAVVCREGFDAGLGSFTSYFGGQQIDASLLLLPKYGFLPVRDERMAATIATIEQHLVEDGLVYRNRSGRPVPEGTFLACSFWLAECQSLQGRPRDARSTIERALGVASDHGLMAEQYDLGSKRLAGNYPQAISHVALLNALLAFDRGGDP